MTTNLPETIQSQMAMAKALASSNLVPRDFRGQPANILLAINLGASLGIEPAVALTEIQVIDGKPTLSAHLQAALVRRAGHRLRIEQKKNQATAILIRSDDPEHEHRATWTMARAEQAGLAGKGAWRQYPESMLVNRAITEVVRFAAPDVLIGVAYDPEELDPEAKVEPPLIEVDGKVYEAEVVEVEIPDEEDVA